MTQSTGLVPSPLNESQDQNEIMEFILRDRMEHLSLMSLALVHQFQTPLIIMRGQVEALLRHPEKNSTPGLQVMADECKSLLQLLDAMTFIMPAGGGQDKRFSQLNQVVRDVLIFFEKTCLDHNISIRADISASIQVRAEPNRLKNILIALISNAVDSFDKKDSGQVRSISLHIQQEARDINLLISDTGIGMSAEVQAQVLRVPFFSTKSHQKGSGLGLSLAQKMCKDLGLELSFVSQEGQGTTFSLCFPLAAYSLESR